jgi:hypothetical protein
VNEIELRVVDDEEAMAEEEITEEESSGGGSDHGDISGSRDGLAGTVCIVDVCEPQSEPQPEPEETSDNDNDGDSSDSAEEVLRVTYFYYNDIVWLCVLL